MRTRAACAAAALVLAVTAAACTSSPAAPASTRSTGSSAASVSSAPAGTDAPSSAASTPSSAPTAAGPLPGMPPVLSSTDVYAADRPGDIAPQAASARAYVYVPDTLSDDVYVIDQHTMKVVRRFAGGHEPQHVVPSYDLRTLYVTADKPGFGSLIPIDPRTGRPGRRINVDDAYNMYFTPDGTYAIVVQEEYFRLAFYDPHTWRPHDALTIRDCRGIDHMDFTADGRLLLVSCEFSNRLAVVDVARHRLVRLIDLHQVPDGKPQDVKLSPDGRVFYVADMIANGIYVIDAHSFRVLRFERTGRGAHGLYISRDARRMFVTNRDEGSISVVDLRTGRPMTKWRLRGGGSPDMGNVSADGKILWLSGRYDGVVYAIDTANGHLVAKIRVGQGPHGLCVWPQPGRYSLGHTGILR